MTTYWNLLMKTANISVKVVATVIVANAITHIAALWLVGPNIRAATFVLIRCVRHVRKLARHLSICPPKCLQPILWGRRHYVFGVSVRLCVGDGIHSEEIRWGRPVVKVVMCSRVDVATESWTWFCNKTSQIIAKTVTSLQLSVSEMSSSR